MARRATALGRVWTTDDTSSLRVSVASLALGDSGRNAAPRELRLGRQFIDGNRSTFAQFGVTADLSPTPDGVDVVLRTSQTVGAVSLLSPSTGRSELGLIIRPRFGWKGIGAILSETGAKIIPELPRLPSLPRSEHEVPRWVLASIICVRLEALLAEPQRKFMQTRQELDRPRGRIEWNKYVTRHVAAGLPQLVPCEFSALQVDAGLLSTVHATVLSQLHALQKVKDDALIIHRLLARFERLRLHVASFAPSWAGLKRLTASIRSSTMLDAFEAMEWTYEERGLAGSADFAGLPWRLSMEKAFEARVESLARLIAIRSGGLVRTGRLRETQRALRWEPPYAGSQRTLIPDVEILRSEETVILDAKYKSHWEDLDDQGWYGASDILRESHRADLLQVLAYGATSEAKRLVCALVYPCKDSTWLSLLKRGRLVHRASVPAGSRDITLLLVAIPFERPLDELADKLRGVFSVT